MGTRKYTLFLLPKGTPPHPQPAQPVGGPLRAFQCEGRRPGTKKEVQPPPTQPHQKRGSRGRPRLPRGFFPPFLPKKWGPGRAGQGSLPFQRRKEKTRNTPRPGEHRPARSNGAGPCTKHPLPYKSIQKREQKEEPPGSFLSRENKGSVYSYGTQLPTPPLRRGHQCLQRGPGLP